MRVAGQKMDLSDRILSATVRPKPIRARFEVRLEDGFQHRLEARLHHPVSHGGNTQLADLTARLRYRHPPHLDRLEPARLQRIPDAAQKHLHPDPGHDPGHRGPIHSRCPRPGVGRHTLPRVHQERRVIDKVEQVTEPASRILTRPTVQFDLHPSYRPEGRIRIRPLHGADVHRRVFEHCIPSLTDTLPSFPMRPGSPRLGVLRRLRPTPPSAGIGPIHHPPPGWEQAWSGIGMVPTFTVARSTGEAPGSTPAASPRLRRRPSPWPPGPEEQCRTRSFPPEMRSGSAPRTSPHPPD